MKAAARAVVDAAGTDSVALLAADGSAAWHDGKGLKKVRAAIDALTADGSTELGTLIDSALAAARSAGKGDDVAIILISDGLVADDAAVAARVDGSQRVHVIGVGAAPNRWLLDEIARRGQGAAIVLGAGDDDADAAVADLVAAAAAPAVTPEIDWGNLTVRDVVPAALPALAAGRSLVIAAHVDSFADATIRVHAGAATMKTKLVAADARKGELVARRWARARVDELVAAGGDSEVIAQLGLAHGLVTPYTALVARGQRVTVEGGVRTTVAIPVAMPAGMRWQAVFGPGGAGTGAGGDAGGELPYTTTESPMPDGAGATDRESDEDGEESVQMAPGSYDSEVILLNGRVIMERRWTGELSLNTGLYVRGDERGAHVGVSGAAYRSLTRTWKVGALAKLQDAPSVEHGIDLAAYLTVRRVIAVGYQPILAVDGGLGASLDERGFAWRVALRLGPWAFAPAFVFDQALGGDATRSSVGVGLGWSW
jgi:hypothetical protein